MAQYMEWQGNMPVNVLQGARTHNKNYLAQNVDRAKVE